MSSKAEDTFSKSSFRGASLLGILHPRNIRLKTEKEKGQSEGNRLWEIQCLTSLVSIEKTDIKKRLKEDGIWVEHETIEMKTVIDSQINYLKQKWPNSEARWSCEFWQKYFFKSQKSLENCQANLRRAVERQQLHSQPLQDSRISLTKTVHPKAEEFDVAEYYPPVVPQTERSYGDSVDFAKEPFIRDKERRGHVFSDISYAGVATVDHHAFFREKFRILPVYRLYAEQDARATIDLAKWEIEEIKPLFLQGEEVGSVRCYEEALRYSSLKAAVLLHEKLKFCCVVANQDFFPEDEFKDLNLHFIAAVGYTAYHYTHCLRAGSKKTLNQPVKYESYLLKKYDLSSSLERIAFCDVLNRLHVYQSLTIRPMELERLRRAQNLSLTEIKSRIGSRAHRYIYFKREMHDGKEMIKAHDSRDLFDRNK